jgi:hypothetical protein
VIPTPDGDPLGRDSATGPLKRSGKAAGAGGKSEDLPSGPTLPGRWQILKLSNLSLRIFYWERWARSEPNIGVAFHGHMILRERLSAAMNFEAGGFFPGTQKESTPPMRRLGLNTEN